MRPLRHLGFINNQKFSDRVHPQLDEDLSLVSQVPLVRDEHRDSPWWNVVFRKCNKSTGDCSPVSSHQRDDPESPRATAYPATGDCLLEFRTVRPMGRGEVGVVALDEESALRVDDCPSADWQGLGKRGERAQ